MYNESSQRQHGLLNFEQNCLRQKYFPALAEFPVQKFSENKRKKKCSNYEVKVIINTFEDQVHKVMLRV